ncbi:MAG: response regulator [Pseudomonadota bacterium]|nr:response regulator [Pseudomonadota bacterium]
MSQEKRGEIIPILLVEDDEDDIAITERAFKRARVSNPLYIVRDGEEALEFLKHTGRYTDPDKAPRPGIILLDLNMPGLDGREVLERIKKDPKLHYIPVVVLTTSSEEADVLGCYVKGANTYITKPVDFEGFMHAVITIGEYWLSIARIPEGY